MKAEEKEKERRRKIRPYRRHLSQCGSFLSHFLFDRRHFSQARGAWVRPRLLLLSCIQDRPWTEFVSGGYPMGCAWKTRRGGGDLPGGVAEVVSDSGVNPEGGISFALIWKRDAAGRFYRSVVVVPFAIDICVRVCVYITQICENGENQEDKVGVGYASQKEAIGEFNNGVWVMMYSRSQLPNLPFRVFFWSLLSLPICLFLFYVSFLNGRSGYLNSLLLLMASFKVGRTQMFAHLWNLLALPQN